MGLDLAEQISQKASRFIQSSNHQDLLGIADSLRSSGASHQSSPDHRVWQSIVGKSSTLESLSGTAFPTAEGLCTRFATELILRRGDRSEPKFKIQPSANWNEEERFKLLKFCEKESEQKSFPKIIEAVKIEMGFSGSKVFSTDVLRIESTSPSAPSLTLVDLLGLLY